MILGFEAPEYPARGFVDRIDFMIEGCGNELLIL
jgi:hypothetical protein